MVLFWLWQLLSVVVVKLLSVDAVAVDAAAAVVRNNLLHQTRHLGAEGGCCCVLRQVWLCTVRVHVAGELVAAACWMVEEVEVCVRCKGGMR